jgi:hypothetical protein
VIPYSASREAASFIKSQQLDQMFIVGSRDANVSPIGGYLNKSFIIQKKKEWVALCCLTSKGKT